MLPAKCLPLVLKFTGFALSGKEHNKKIQVKLE
jgi:hypothetical protein